VAIQFLVWHRLLGRWHCGYLAVSFQQDFRKRLSQSDTDLETIGLIVLVIAAVIIGLYNHFGRSSGA
jgi:hypothetical protein